MRRVPEDRRQAGSLSYDGSTLCALHSNCIVPAEAELTQPVLILNPIAATIRRCQESQSFRNSANIRVELVLSPD